MFLTFYKYEFGDICKHKPSFRFFNRGLYVDSNN